MNSGTAGSILLVGDDPGTAAQARMTLEGAGYRVTVASTGRIGLATVEAERPDLIVLDDTLPDMTDGYEFLIHLKRIPQNRDIPIIRVTEPAHTADTFRGGGGVDAYLTKPFNPHQLVAFVMRILEEPGWEGVWNEVFDV